jgi:hypothetical protein
MTEPRRPPRRPSPGWVFASAFAAFAAALGLLAVQVRAGRDAALGAGTPVAVAPERPRPVVVRRIVRTTIVTHVVRPNAPSAPTAPATSPRPATTAAPAAPPAPAPAPVTTQAS